MYREIKEILSQVNLESNYANLQKNSLIYITYLFAPLVNPQISPLPRKIDR